MEMMFDDLAVDAQKNSLMKRIGAFPNFSKLFRPFRKGK